MLIFLAHLFPCKYIRRIANHHIESSFGKDLWELVLPVKRLVARYGGVANEGVAAFDVLVEGIELAVGLGGAEPEGELCYLYALLVDVHAIEVVFEDALLHVLEDER